MRLYVDHARREQARCNFFVAASPSSSSSSATTSSSIRSSDDVEMYFENALRDARAADQKMLFSKNDDDELGALHGVPIAVKSNICALGQRTACGSRMLDSFVSPYDATVVKRLRAAGAIPFGRTTMDEFGMGSFTTTSAVDGASRNPHSTTHSCGGSSGGSAACVASGSAIAAIGSDTGGSVRQPAAHCGVVGLKPSYGRISRWGLVSYASSLDTIGLFARSTQDCAHLLSAVAGADGLDETALATPCMQSSHTRPTTLAGVRVGVPREYLIDELDSNVERAWRSAATRLAHAGAIIVPISLPLTPFALPTYYIIASAEAASNLARYDGVRYGTSSFANSNQSTQNAYKSIRSRDFGREVQRRILLGSFVLSQGSFDEYYGQALRVRRLIVNDFENAFDKVDVLLTPVTPTSARRLNDIAQLHPLDGYADDVMTVAVSLAGLPAVSVPFHDDSVTSNSARRMPIGLQLIGNFDDDMNLLHIASFLENKPSI